MVSPWIRSLIGEVLYSPTTRVWKIADFGIAQQGTSRTPLITTSSRGTASYRAPELLTDSPIYTNKVDIWAFGCIAFEIFTGRKRFGSDWEVQNLAQTMPSISKLTPIEVDVEKSIIKLIEETSRIDWTARPDGPEIVERVTNIGLLLLKSTRVPEQWKRCESCSHIWKERVHSP
jgi:serine/threonine protein kinase